MIKNDWEIDMEEEIEQMFDEMDRVQWIDENIWIVMPE